MSRVRTTIWMAVICVTALTSSVALGDNTQAEIRRLQEELDRLQASLDAGNTGNELDWPAFSFFGKVSVDAIYDDKNAGLEELLIPSTIPSGDIHQQNFTLHAKNSQFGFRVGESEGPHMVFAADLFGSIDSYDIRIRDFYFQHGALRAGYGFTALLDGAAWPLTLDAQGPNSAIFARQTGVRWQGEHLTIALEDPNPEVYDPTNLSSASGRRPDAIITWKQPFAVGHLQLGLVNREIGVEFADGEQQFTTGTGGVLSGALTLADTVKLMGNASYGQAMAHYYNDLSGFGDGGMDGYVFPDGQLEPLLGQGGYAGIEWQATPKWTLAMVGGQIVIESDQALPDEALRRTRYGTLTAERAMSPRLSYGAEVSYGLRDTQGGDRSEVPRIQLNVTYRFAHTSRH